MLVAQEWERAAAGLGAGSLKNSMDSVQAWMQVRTPPPSGAQIHANKVLAGATCSRSINLSYPFKIHRRVHVCLDYHMDALATLRSDGVLSLLET